MNTNLYGNVIELSFERKMHYDVISRFCCLERFCRNMEALHQSKEVYYII